MITYNDDFWDTLADDLVELTPAQLQVQQAKMDNETRIEQRREEERAKNIRRFISANPRYSVRDLTSKFYLDWEVAKNYGNGLARIKFTTGDVIVFEMHLPINEWFGN